MNIKRATGGFLLSFVFLLAFMYMIFGAQWFFENSLPSQGTASIASVSDSIQNIVPENIAENPAEVAPKIEINADSALSIETNSSGINKVIFEKDSNVRLPIASLTKLMTAVVALDGYDLSEIITIDKMSDLQDPMKQDVKLGDRLSVESLLKIMLVKSSNKSAYALAVNMGEQKFVGLMNEKAKKIGLENTFFADPTGLSSKDISTASDLAKLAEYIIKNYPKIADISSAKELDVPGFGKIINTDQLLGEVPEIVCSKTGFTTEAKGCLLLVTGPKGYLPNNNGYLINVILGADDRFSEMRKLINWSNINCK